MRPFVDGLVDKCIYLSPFGVDGIICLGMFEKAAMFDIFYVKSETKIKG